MSIVLSIPPTSCRLVSCFEVCLHKTTNLSPIKPVVGFHFVGTTPDLFVNLMCNDVSAAQYIWSTVFSGLPHLSCSRASSSPFSRPMAQPSHSPSGVCPGNSKGKHRALFWLPEKSCRNLSANAGSPSAPGSSWSVPTGGMEMPTAIW